MNAGRRERREHPDLVVGDEQVRPGRPLLVVAIVRLETGQSLFGWDRVPLRERRIAGVVHAPRTAAAIDRTAACERSPRTRSGESLADDSFPSWHRAPPRSLHVGPTRPVPYRATSAGPQGRNDIRRFSSPNFVLARVGDPQRPFQTNPSRPSTGAVRLVPTIRADRRRRRICDMIPVGRSPRTGWRSCSSRSASPDSAFSAWARAISR